MRRTKREAVYAAALARGSFVSRTIADDCGIVSVKAVRRLLGRMTEDGLLRRVNASRFELTPSGKARIERGTAG